MGMLTFLELGLGLGWGRCGVGMFTFLELGVGCGCERSLNLDTWSMLRHWV